MAKPVVFVIGASGFVGSATVRALAEKYADKVEIRAGVRQPDKADKLKNIVGVTVVQATMGDNESLKGILNGVDALYIVTPGAENCSQLAISTAEAAKEVGVKHLMAVSVHVTVAKIGDTILGAPYAEVEDAITKLGVPFTILRLPNFADNLWSHKRSIVGQGVITGARNPERVSPQIVVEDAGKAGAAILVDPSRHTGKTYELVSYCCSYNDVVKCFSEALGREIKYNRISVEDMKQRLLVVRLPQWQSDGLLELLKLEIEDSSSTSQLNLSDCETITGEKPTTLKAWIEKNVSGFQ